MAEKENLIGKDILNYRIESLIGKGGMGSVYLAVNKNITQRVAVKVLNTNLAESPIIRRKFMNEAKTLLALDHPHIVKFLNFVENDEGIFLIMEYVDGITLDDFINTKQGLIIEPKVYELFDQILDAFAYAHKKGIIHRDIKPANIILTHDNEGNFVLKVLDFGIARIVSDSNDDEKGMVIGTPAYMSPEQVRGEEVDERSDIYSLGVLLHQMLTGRMPFDLTTLSETEIQKKVIEEPLPRMKIFYQYISDRMQKVVDKATAKNPAARYASCIVFRKDFLPKPPVPLWRKIAVTAACLLFLAGGLWFWDYNYHTKVYYYKDYVEQWGIPVGIGKLTPSEFENRTSSYRFEKKKGKIVRFTHVNSKGNIIEHRDSEYMERFDDMLLAYTEKGNIDYVKRLDRNGKVLYIMDYDDDLKTANFKYDDDAKTEITLSASTTKLFTSAFSASNEKSNISKYLLTYDDNGYLSELRYAGFRISQICDNEGIYGKRFIVDGKGRVIEEHYLGKDYTPKANKAGLAIKKMEYEDNGFTKASYFTADGKPSFDGNGCHICAIEYDKYGNRKKETYYDRERNITLRTDNKIAGYTYVVENGFLTQQTAFDVDNKTCYVSRNTNDAYNVFFGYASAKYEYDSQGYMNRITFFDAEGKNVIMGYGIGMVKFENDLKGNLLKQVCFDTENKISENIYGYSKLTTQYDSIGNVTSEYYLNTQDSLCVTKDGIAGFTCEFDKNSKITKQTYFGANNEPCEDNLGVITIIQDYDKDENLKRVTYLAADGKTPRLNHEDIAGWNSDYKDGYEIERAFFDARGNLTAGSIGYARWTAKYDENGLLKEMSYFDKDENSGLFYNSNLGLSYSKVEYNYDKEHGNIIEEIHNDGKKARKNIIRYKYDKYNNVAEISFFNGNASAATCNAGWHKTTLTYNNQQQVTEQKYYNTNNKLTLISDQVGKYAILKNEYDRIGRISRQTYFDVKGHPTPASVHIPESLTGYDKYGNINYIASADGNGNVIYNSKAGFAYMEKKHDVRGNVIEERYFNINKKMRQKDFAIARYKYDKLGRLVEYSIYNNLDKAADFDRWHKYIMNYDEQGFPLYQKYYSLNNSLIGTFKYNKKKEEWEYQYDWRQYWRDSSSGCPFQIEYGIEVLSITLTTKGCDIIVRFLGISKYSIESSELEECKKWGRQFVQHYKKDAQMPAGTQLTTIGVDKERREVFRVTN